MVDIKDDEPIDAEKFFELQDEEIELRFEETLTNFMNDLDDTGKAYLRFKKAGGNDASFFKAFAQTSEIPTGELRTVEDYDKTLRYYYKTFEDMDESDIDEKLEWLEESGKKEKYAKRYGEKMEAHKKTTEEKFLKDQDDVQKKLNEDTQNFIKSVKETAQKTDSHKGFKFIAKEKNELTDYIIKPTVKLQNGKYITGLQNAINGIFKGDRENLLLLAKLLKSDFDFKEFVAEARTKVTKETKLKLNERKNTFQSIKQTDC